MGTLDKMSWPDGSTVASHRYVQCDSMSLGAKVFWRQVAVEFGPALDQHCSRTQGCARSASANCGVTCRQELHRSPMVRNFGPMGAQLHHAPPPPSRERMRTRTGLALAGLLACSRSMGSRPEGLPHNSSRKVFVACCGVERTRVPPIELVDPSPPPKKKLLKPRPCITCKLQSGLPRSLQAQLLERISWPCSQTSLSLSLSLSLALFPSRGFLSIILLVSQPASCKAMMSAPQRDSSRNICTNLACKGRSARDTSRPGPTQLWVPPSPCFLNPYRGRRIDMAANTLSWSRSCLRLLGWPWEGGLGWPPCASQHPQTARRGH